MTVFKSYFKVLLRYKWIILLYTGICIGVSLINMSSGAGTTNQYTDTLSKVAIINNDEQTELITGLTEYMGQKSKIKELPNNEEKIQDSLFYREVDYVLVIPENFTKDFLNKQETKIEIKKTPEGYATYTEMLLNKYLKLADIYCRSGMTEKEIVQCIKVDLEKETNIIIENEQEQKNVNNAYLYYNFANYSFLAISIFLIATVMSVFNNEMIKKKNNICKMKYKDISNQLFLGNILFVFVIWLLYVLISFVLCKEVMLTTNGLLLILSSFVFIINAATIGFLVSSLVKNKNAISGIVNVVALGLSFISGCFVPQQWLNSTVLNVAKLFPSYWYINANGKILELTKFDFENLKPIILNFGIIFGFTIIYIIIIKLINNFIKKS